MSSSGLVPLWVQIPAALLLVSSGLLALTGAVGVLRLKDFFQRMHPPALGATLGTWCACAASMIYLSATGSQPVIHTWLIPIFLALTMPVTTLLLARAALFRRRQAGANVPPPLSRGTGSRRTAHAAGSIIVDPGDDLP